MTTTNTTDNKTSFSYTSGTELSYTSIGSSIGSHKDECYTFKDVLADGFGAPIVLMNRFPAKLTEGNNNDSGTEKNDVKDLQVKVKHYRPEEKSMAATKMSVVARKQRSSRIILGHVKKYINRQRPLPAIRPELKSPESLPKPLEEIKKKVIYNYHEEHPGKVTETKTSFDAILYRRKENYVSVAELMGRKKRNNSTRTPLKKVTEKILKSLGQKERGGRRMKKKSSTNRAKTMR